MTNFIDSSFFTVDIDIPESTFGNIDLFIAKYEKELLISLLGYDQYKELIDAYELSLAPEPTDLPAKWSELLTGKTYTLNGKTARWGGLADPDNSPIAYYVYAKKLTDEQTHQAQLGRVQPQGENSTPADAVPSIVSAWNKFVALYNDCFGFMYANQDVYDCDYATEYKPANIFGL